MGREPRHRRRTGRSVVGEGPSGDDKGSGGRWMEAIRRIRSMNNQQSYTPCDYLRTPKKGKIGERWTT